MAPPQTADWTGFLAHAVRGLAGGDLDQAMVDVAAAAVPAVADLCAIHLADEEGLLPRLAAVAHVDPAVAERVRAAQSVDGQRAIGEWMARPGPTALGDDAARLVPGADLASGVALPLRSRGRSLGLLILGRTGERVDRLDGSSDGERLAAEVLALAVDSAVARQGHDEFLSILSHDLRNPLNVILLVVDVLGVDASGSMVAAQLGKLQRSAMHLSNLLTDVVDAGRLESGALRLERQTVAPERILTEAIEAVRTVATDKKIRVAIDDLLATELRVDPPRMIRAVRYLLESAIRRMPSGGAITVSVVADGDEALWSLADSGPDLGGSPGVDSSRLRSGSALAWTVARQIIETHGGRMWIDGGGGSGLVRFTLPLTA